MSEKEKPEVLPCVPASAPGRAMSRDALDPYMPDQSFLFPKASHRSAAPTETTKSTSINLTSTGFPTSKVNRLSTGMKRAHSEGFRIHFPEPRVEQHDFFLLQSDTRVCHNPLRERPGDEEGVKTDQNPLDAFLDLLAQPLPNPGGGSAAAHGALVAIALLEKIVRIEMGRCRENTNAPLWPDFLDEVRKATAELVNLREQDGRVYARLSAARQDTPRALGEALDEAIGVPVRIMHTAAAIIDLAGRVGQACARHLIADVQVSCELLTAAVEGSYHIARANVGLMAQGPLRVAESDRLDAARDDCRTLANRAKGALKQRAAE